MQTLSQVVFNRLNDESYIFERRPQLLHRLQVQLNMLTLYILISHTFFILEFLKTAEFFDIEGFTWR